MYKWPLTDSTTIKDHNVVAHVRKAPRSGDSVVETGMEEIMVDMATGSAICLPNAKYSTTHRMGENSHPTTIVPTPWSSESSGPSSQTVSSATPVSPTSPAFGSSSSLKIHQHRHGTQQVTDMQF